MRLGIGVAMGFATIGAIGNVTNLAARLCGEASGGEILAAPRVVAAPGEGFATEPAGELPLKGLARPVQVVRVVGEKP